MLTDDRALIVADGVLAEPPSPDGRLVLRLPGEVASGCRHRDRVGNVARAEVVADGGIRSIADASAPAR